MSHSLLWRPIVLLTVCLFEQPPSVCNIGISITRIFQKSVRQSVRLIVTLTKMPTPHSLLTVE